MMVLVMMELMMKVMIIVSFRGARSTLRSGVEHRRGSKDPN